MQTTTEQTILTGFASARRGFGPPSTVGALAILAMFLISSAASGQRLAAPETRVFALESPSITFSADFPGARLNQCEREGPDRYRLVIRPENEPINNSAWYAFQVTAESARTIAARLVYEGGTHRYRPKISRDGRHWSPLASDAWKVEKGRQEAVLRLEVGPAPLWVAAQELLTSDAMNAWIDTMAGRPFITKSVLGQSVLGRPIYKLDVAEAPSARYVYIVGRQHPPEVTGSLALMAFVETLAADTELARRFRARYNVVVVPLMNPDGVDRGHWRHNANGVDLNRDWRDFRQPETRAVRDDLVRFADEGGPRLEVFLDFHSTHHDVFYTQPDDVKTVPEDFARQWLGALGERFPDYDLRRDGTHGSKLNTSKRWVYELLRVPAITYEIGDRTDRELIRTITRGSAEEMMRLLLRERDPEQAKMGRPLDGNGRRLFASAAGRKAPVTRGASVRILAR